MDSKLSDDDSTTTNTISKQEDLDKKLTSCKDCVFAHYEGITQTACVLDLLKEYDGCVVEAKDEEKEFYLINGRYCFYKRSPKWIENLEYVGLPTDDLVNQVKVENKITYHLIVTEASDHNKTLEYLDRVQKLSYKPFKISILNEGINNEKLAKRISKKNKLPEWKLYGLTEGAPKLQLINDAIKSTKLPYLLITSIKDELTDEFLEDVSQRIFLKGQNFFLFKHKSHLFSTKLVSDHYNGYSFATTLEEKIIEDNEQKNIIEI